MGQVDASDVNESLGKSQGRIQSSSQVSGSQVSGNQVSGSILPSSENACSGSHEASEIG